MSKLLAHEYPQVKVYIAFDDLFFSFSFISFRYS